MNPEWLRYYIAAKLNARVEDIDFNPDDFIARVNSDLIGKYVNIASRAAGFIAKRFDGRLSRRRRRRGPQLLDAPARARDADRARCTTSASSARRCARSWLLADQVNALRRPAQAVGAGQGAGQARRAARRLQRSASRPSAC